jgi:hypothetical protein
MIINVLASLYFCLLPFTRWISFIIEVRGYLKKLRISIYKYIDTWCIHIYIYTYIYIYIYIYLLGICLFAFVSFCTVALFYYRSSRLLKTLQLRMQAVIVLGGFVGAARYIYMYIYICMYIYIYIHIYTYVYIYMYIYKYKYLYTYIYAYIQGYCRTAKRHQYQFPIYLYIYIYICTSIYIFILYTNIYLHTYLLFEYNRILSPSLYT